MGCDREAQSTASFLLEAEGLSCLLKHHNLSSELHGLKVAPLHLLFVNDSMLLFKADTECAIKVPAVSHLLFTNDGMLLF
jgi:hypothetical protein